MRRLASLSAELRQAGVVRLALLAREGRGSFADRKHFVMLHNIYDVAELHFVALFVCPAAGVLRPTRRPNMLDVYEHGLEGFPRRMILGVKRSWAHLREGRLRSWVPEALVQPCVSAAPARHVHIDPASRAFFGGSLSNYQQYPLSIRLAFLDTWGCIAVPRHLPKNRFRCCGLGVCVLGSIPQG